MLFQKFGFILAFLHNSLSKGLFHRRMYGSLRQAQGKLAHHDIKLGKFHIPRTNTIYTFFCNRRTMSSSHHSHHSSGKSFVAGQPGILRELWDSFWYPPGVVCPKCGSPATEYYDPFFFTPVRTFTGKRRIKCTNCRFIWRPSQRGKSLWEKVKPIM